MKILKRIVTPLLALFLIFGCASKIPHQLVSGYEKKGARLIAVMPVNHQCADATAPQMFRQKVISELYFKGYPRITPGVIDEKLSSLYGGTTELSRGDIPPASVGELLNVDAVLYVTLTECTTSYRLVYASVVVSAALEMRSAKTGETLWNVRHRAVKRTFGITGKQLEMGSREIFEPALQEVVDKTLDTLPYGPDL